MIPPLNIIEVQRRDSLQPHVQLKFEEFRAVVWLELKTRLYLASATRSFDQQQALFWQGRAGDSEKIVTNARPGQSWHNFGLAFDVALIAMPESSRLLLWDIPENVGSLGEGVGLEWGERWAKFPDNNHFQLTGELTLVEANRAWPSGFLS
jgi:peptidoglycan L-alanyl-D-glutamate endopeptidase CwlK